MKNLATYEEFIGDKHLGVKQKKSQEVYSVNTNDPNKEYDDEKDGGDTINGSPLNGNR